MAFASHPASETGEDTGAALHAAIRSFVSTASFEMAAGDLDGLEAAKPWLSAGGMISITWLPKDNHDDRIAASRALTDAGFVAVPHIAARRIADSGELDRLLARLALEAGVRRAFLIAGDVPKAQGAFESSLQLLRTGLFERRGFTTIGIAGYPEGHPKISDDLLGFEANAKIATGWRAGMDTEIITQFCFEAPPISQWLAAFRTRHPQHSVRIGLAGPAGLRTLLHYARLCGLGTSIRALAGQAGSIARLLTDAGPDPVIRDLMTDPAVRQQPSVKLHLFPFGGLARTARWADRVARGDFTLSMSEAGFRVRQ